ncbi:ComEC/Rec2 family competence protein [Mangrovimonas xylaniphaga]|uniref:ComEC/Rec2 family competence protein n=1 Tax=Mangrovimonas xylaniphaga TaxID=1645915 RepID=UPI0006B4CAF8|nr:MBL fold metallo-hydrolase [Mangrovimonas xylaniphaga]
MIFKKKYKLLLCGFLSSLLLFSQEEFPSWEEGVMEIHHINTGRGDACFVIMPDGTTLLIDAGDTSETHPRTLSARNEVLKPNNTKSAPEWIVDYIRQFAPKSKPVNLDYALITHYHDDHFGEADSVRTLAPGGYQLTGIMEVGTLMPIKTLIDRGSEFPINLKDKKVQSQERFINDSYKMMATLREYWKFIDFQNKTNGLVHETLKAGEKYQIQLLYAPENYPEFHIQNVAVNGQIWTGEKNFTFDLFKEGDYPGENPLSTCIKITYGKFDYFTGGDVNGIDELGGTNFNSLESNIAPVVGAVDVAALNHHGNRDSQNAYYVRTIRPRVWVQQNWSSDHPGDDVLRRILSEKIYPGERDVFSTTMLQANRDVIGGKLDQYKSQNGHVVVRVEKGGDAYKVFVLNDTTQTRELLKQFGPYESR